LLTSLSRHGGQRAQREACKGRLDVTPEAVAHDDLASPLKANIHDDKATPLKAATPVRELMLPAKAAPTELELVAHADLEGQVQAQAQVAITGDHAIELEPSHQPTNETEEAGAEGPLWRSIMLKVAGTVGLFVVVSVFLERVAGEHITTVSRQLVERAGWPGLFLAVFVLDAIPQPFPYIPLIFVAVKGGMAKTAVLLICAGASYTAALSGYGVGRLLRGPSWGRNIFGRFAKKYPQIPDLMERRGGIGVLLAALLPAPLAIATWTAGFFGVSFPHFLAAAAGRCPKIAVIVLLSRGPGQRLL